MALQLAACKKQTFVEPEVSKTKQKIIDVKALKAVRAWYAQEQEAFKTLRKASRSIGIDSLPFLPQWEQVQTFVLSDSSKLLVSPVIRYALVSYNMQIGFVRKMAVHLDANDHIKEARILEFVGERNYIASYQDSLALWFIERKLWQGFVLNFDITHQFLSNQQTRSESVGVECNKNGLILQIEYIETSEKGICIEKTTYFYGFNELGKPITCTDSESTICPISVTAPGNGGGGAGSTGGNPGGNPVSFPVTGGIAVGSNPWSGWGLGSDYGGGIGTTPIYVYNPNAGQYPIDPGTNIGGPRGHQISDPIEDARVLAQLNEITESYGVLQSDGTFQYAPTQKQKLELARTLDRLINQHPAYNNMYDLYKQKNIKVTWRIKADLGNGSTRGKAQIMVSPNGTRQNFISFSGTNSLKNNSTVAEEMIHILQLDKKGELTGNYSVPDDQRVCIEFEAKAAIKMIAANGAGSKFDTDTFFDLKDRYKDTNPTRYNEIINFEKNTKDFFEKYKKMPLPKSRNEMNWVLFMNLLYDFNQYGPAGYNFPATYDANTWQWAIMFELFNY